MKNELHPWEVGIAEQIKGKEFSFDPQAFADFEDLLQAETLGQEPGHRAPEAGGEVMSPAATTISLPTILLIIGVVSFSGWWFWPRETSVPAEPAVSTTAPAVLPAPTSDIAPAAAPTPAAPLENNVLVSTSGLNNKSTKVTPPLSPSSSDELPIEITNTEKETEELMTRPPRILRATDRLTSLPIEAVAPLQTTSIPLPPIQEPTPIPQKRNRKALFPEVIKKN